MAGRGAYNRRGRDRWQPNERQRQVLDLLVDGKTNAQIAEQLQISIDGAKWHVSELLGQTGRVDREELVSWWRQQRIRRGLIGMISSPLLRGAAAMLGLVVLVWFVAVLATNRRDSPELGSALNPSSTPMAFTPSPVNEKEVFSPYPVSYVAGDVPSSCPASQRWKLRPDDEMSPLPGFGTGDGQGAWLSWLPVTGWAGPGYLNPVRWTITPDVTDDIILTGHRLDGDDVARFASNERPEDLADSISLPAPHNYFHRIYVVIPSPGCWQFDLSTGTDSMQVTVYIQGDPIPPACPVSPAQVVKPSIAPGLGEGIVWMIAGQLIPWLGPDVPIKTIWLINASVSSSVTVSGQVLGGTDVATFVSVDDIPDYENVAPGADQTTVDAVSARNHDRLLAHRQVERVIEPPHDIGIDRRGYIFYPAPGCYRFTAHTDQGTFEVTQYVSP